MKYVTNVNTFNLFINKHITDNKGIVVSNISS